MKAKQLFFIFSLLFIAVRLSVAAPPLSVSVDGTGPFKYQWYRSPDSSYIGGTAIDKATDSVYTPTSVDGGYHYYCVIANDCKSVVSNISGMYRLISVTGCPTSVPGFAGGVLGQVFYGNDTNTDINTGATVIDGNGITQTWSAAVLAEGCDKTVYYGSQSSDCRKSHNTDRYYTNCGDLFSWCAVMKYREDLCPAPWRIPTRQDFINLDLALGGTGQNRAGDNPAGVRIKYSTTPTGAQAWGGGFGGYCNAGGISYQGSRMNYWSASEENSNNAWHFGLNPTGHINPSESSGKNYGTGLRCIKGE